MARSTVVIVVDDNAGILRAWRGCSQSYEIVISREAGHEININHSRICIVGLRYGSDS
jgi:hypothetical protein